MKNIKKIIFYFIISILPVKFFALFEKASKNLVIGGVESARIMADAAPNIGINAANVLAQAGVKSTTIASAAVLEGTQKIVDASTNLAAATVESATIASTAIAEGTQKIGDAIEIVAEAGKVISKDISEGLVKSSATIGSEAVEKLAPVAQVCVAIVAVKAVYDIGTDLYAYVYPDEATVARTKDAKKKIAILDKEEVFRTCLMKNAKEPRNKIGIPVNCEECGQIFSMTAGRAAFKEMVETFKETY